MDGNYTSGEEHEVGFKFFKNHSQAQVGVAQWIECRPANWKAAGLICGQGTCLGFSSPDGGM